MPSGDNQSSFECVQLWEQIDEVTHIVHLCEEIWTDSTTFKTA